METLYYIKDTKGNKTYFKSLTAAHVWCIINNRYPKIYRDKN